VANEIEIWLEKMASYLENAWGIDKSFSRNAATLYLYFAQYGLSPVITSGRRSREKQEELTKRYLSGDRSVVVAPAKNSKHLDGLAIDISTNNPGTAAAIATALKIGAGQYFSAPDPVHFYKL
jgi:hypothetical protein